MRRNLLFLSGLLILTLACFWPVGRLGFIDYDDWAYVYKNPRVLSGLSWDNFTWALSAVHASNWHPLTWLSHMADCQFFGLNPHEQHWMNLGFHAADTLLLFCLLQQMTGSRWRSFFVAALFAVHPLHVQSVAWVSERKDVLSAFFAFLTLQFYVFYIRGHDHPPSTRQAPGGGISSFFIHHSSFSYHASWFCFACGLMAKPMLVTLPLILLWLDYWPLGRLSLEKPAREWKPLIMEKLPLFALGLGSCAMTIWAQNAGGAVSSLETIPLTNRCLHVAVAYAEYLGKLFWPANLAIFYPYPTAKPDLIIFLGATLILAAITLIAFRLRDSRPWLLAGWCWFVIMLVPVIGLVQVGAQSIADRYAYLPSIGIFIMLAWSMAAPATHAGPAATPPPDAASAATAPQRLTPPGIAAATTGFLVILACAFDTHYQLQFWKDSVSLFAHAVQVTPEHNKYGYNFLGSAQGEAGDLNGAIKSYEASLAVDPDFDLAHAGLGKILLAQQKFAEAEAQFRDITPPYSVDFPAITAHMHLGMALAGQKRYAEAIAEYQAALQLQPGNANIQKFLTATAQCLDAAMALTNFLSQLKTNDTPALHIQAAMAQTFLGEPAAAIQQYESALAKDPDSETALNNLAWLLATSPDPSIRNGPQAVRYAEHACALAHDQKTLLIGTLAAAYAEAGRFDEAIATAQKACARAAAQGETDLLQHNQELLALYQKHEPYCEPPKSPVPGRAPLTSIN